MIDAYGRYHRIWVRKRQKHFCHRKSQRPHSYLQKMDIEKIKRGPVPSHIAVIMDGNRRWAKENNLPIIKGHEAGTRALENLLDFLLKNPDLNIKHVTVYSLSEDNKTKRSPEQLNALMRLFKIGFAKLAKDRRIKENQIKVNIFGNYRSLPKDVVKEIEKCIEISKDNNKLNLNFCIAYDGQSEIVRACREIVKKTKNDEIDDHEISKELVKSNLFTAYIPAPELIIRSGKEKRLSAFLLWDSSYSELYFSDKYWPDMANDDFLQAIEDFQKRHRKFGR